ncbi:MULTISPECIES: C40 family peptidase [unclassified Meiothermus]|uniref:C40 family peptidase n=1 Tax=unclassified Meiothermus TaxID=370471 RepID=UPI000D7D09E4|nr:MULTISPECIES: C40 family peptidase [unclassified Meiothermus]PZA07603.1 peptidoglycan endopeptidase [Meiothermus sp. Pnk-1]RYM36820.1 peptidoglycan endopeptidase [Meiothermus sp. PNK-Is4]
MRILAVVVLLGLAGAQELFHTVQRGETLFSIARRYGTTVETLMRLNGLSRPNLEVGQVLRLPAPAAQPQPAAATYSVQPGDTLFSIARRFGVTVEALQGENNLTDTALSVGQVLKLPAPSPVAPSPQSPGPAFSREYDPAHPVLQAALKYLGTPYKFAANSETALDCSAFVQRVYAEVGLELPRTSREQWDTLPAVQGEVRPGDLVFFSFGGHQIDHVGIYLGRGVFAHASTYGSRVVIESLEAPYYQKTYRGARRPELPVQTLK